MAPRLKKSKVEGAPEATPANGSSLEPAIKAFYSDSTGAPKRKGKAPSQKTLLVRAGIAQFPNLSPKALAAELNRLHPGFDFKNNDVSQQKLQLRPKDEKKKTGKTSPRKAAAVAPTAPTTPVKTTPYIVQLADLAKKVGTGKIREVCDLIDYFGK
jgi:hypothetical protein